MKIMVLIFSLWDGTVGSFGCWWWSVITGCEGVIAHRGGDRRGSTKALLKPPASDL